MKVGKRLLAIFMAGLMTVPQAISGVGAEELTDNTSAVENTIDVFNNEFEIYEDSGIDDNIFSDDEGVTEEIEEAEDIYSAYDKEEAEAEYDINSDEEILFDGDQDTEELSDDNLLFVENEGTFEFGEYPQTIVEDEALIKILEEKSKGYNDRDNYTITYQAKKYYHSGGSNWYIWEPIEWIILSGNGSKSLLMSKYILDNHSYGTIDDMCVAWKDSDLRRWLNDDFMNRAFTKEEQECIYLTDNVSCDGHEDEKVTTTEKITLPSDEQVKGFSQAIKQGIGTGYSGKGNHNYHTRCLHSYYGVWDYPIWVTDDCEFNSSYPANWGRGIRPCITVNLVEAQVVEINKQTDKDLPDTTATLTIVDIDDKPLSGVEVYHYGKGPFVSDDKGNVKVPSIGSTDELSSEDNNYSDYSLVFVKEGYRTKKYRQFELQGDAKSKGISTEELTSADTDYADQEGDVDQLSFVGSTDLSEVGKYDELLGSAESSIDELISVDATAATISKIGMDKPVSTYNKEFYYLAYGDTHDSHVECEYNDNYFLSSNGNYNHDLAKMSIALAMSAFNSSVYDKKTSNDTDTTEYSYYYNENIPGANKIIEKTPACNVANLMYNCGFDDISINEGYTISTKYDEKLNDGNNIGVCMGNKILSDGSTLIAIAVRGAGYGCEWVGNFSVEGVDGYHRGFYSASLKVQSKLVQYIKDYNLTGKKIKVWITGYSRGGAIANLTAAYLCENGIAGCQFDGNSIFAYTFEAPQGTKKSNYNVGLFKGIWNIVNPVDVVPKVAMEGWGYHRYGNSVFMPSDETQHYTYQYYKQAVLRNFRGYLANNSITLPNLAGQKYLLDHLVSALASSTGNDASDSALALQAILQDYFRGNFWVTIGDAIKEVITKTILFLNPVGQAKSITSSDLDTAKSAVNNSAYAALNGVLDEIAKAHYPELALAWMNTIPSNMASTTGIISHTPISNIAGNITNKAGIISSYLICNCPIDIAVYDQTGKLQLKIINNEVKPEQNSAIQAMIDADGQKIICVPGDVQAKVEILATGDGEFNYSIQEDHLSDEVPSKLICYTPVKIKKGDTLIGTVSAGDTNGNVTYHLTNQGNEVPVEATLSGGKAETVYQVSVVVEGNGKVSDNTYKKYGEFVEVVAEPGSGATFVGWYEENNLLSKEKTYRHRVVKGTMLTAKFEGGPADTKPAPSITNVYNSAKGGDIRWKAQPDCSGYAVYRQRSAEGIQKVAVITDPNTTQCFDPGIKDNCYGRVYHYYITALYKDSSGKTVESAPSDKLVLQRLAPMKITKVNQTSGTSVSLNWACAVNENKSYGYEVQYAEKNTDLYDRVGTFKAFPVEGRSNLTAAINGLKSGKKYWIRVRCYVNYTHSVTGALTKTWSQYSNIVTVTLSSVSNTTPAYQVTDSLANYRSGIWIYWTPTNAKGYNVYRKTGANGSWKLIKYLAGQNNYRYHDAEVKDKNGVMYYYTVRGVIGSKLSDYDKNGRGILRLIPADFTKTVNSASGTVTLVWNKNTAATGYEVQYSKDEEFETIISTVNIPSKDTVTTEIKGLEKGETYYFHARAYTVQGGDTYYGQWSSLGTVKIEK